MPWLTSAKLMGAAFAGALVMAVVHRATTRPDFVREMPIGSIYAAMWNVLWIGIVFVAGQVLEAATGIQHFFYAFIAGVLIVPITSIWRASRRASGLRPRILQLLDQGMSASEVAKAIEIDEETVVFFAEIRERKGR